MEMKKESVKKSVEVVKAADDKQAQEEMKVINEKKAAAEKSLLIANFKPQ